MNINICSSWHFVQKFNLWKLSIPNFILKIRWKQLFVCVSVSLVLRPQRSKCPGEHGSQRQDKFSPRGWNINSDVLKGKMLVTKLPQRFRILILVSEVHKAGVGTCGQLSSHLDFWSKLWSLRFYIPLDLWNTQHSSWTALCV